MPNNKNNQSKKSNFWPALIGILGFLATYIAVDTDTTRDKLPEKQAQELVSEGTTALIKWGGVAAMLGAIAWSNARNRKGKERE